MIKIMSSSLCIFRYFESLGNEQLISCVILSQDEVLFEGSSDWLAEINNEVVTQKITGEMTNLLFGHDYFWRLEKTELNANKH